MATGVTTTLRKKLYLPRRGTRRKKEERKKGKKKREVNFITRQSCPSQRGGVEKVKIIFPGKICDYQRAERKLPRHGRTAMVLEWKGKESCGTRWVGR